MFAQHSNQYVFWLSSDIIGIFVRKDTFNLVSFSSCHIFCQSYETINLCSVLGTHLSKEYEGFFAHAVGLPLSIWLMLSINFIIGVTRTICNLHFHGKLPFYISKLRDRLFYRQYVWDDWCKVKCWFSRQATTWMISTGQSPYSSISKV